MRLTGTVLIAAILHLATLPGVVQSKPLFEGSHEIFLRVISRPAWWTAGLLPGTGRSKRARSSTPAV